MDWCIQLQVTAGLPQRGDVTNLGFNFYDVRDFSFSCWLKVWLKIHFLIGMVRQIRRVRLLLNLERQSNVVPVKQVRG